MSLATVRKLKTILSARLPNGHAFRLLPDDACKQDGGSGIS